MPWDAWYEPNGPARRPEADLREPLLAARRDANVWVPEGQDRGGGGIPSLNINVDKEAEDPAVVGGAAVQGADPVPWVAWQEQDGNVNGAGNHPQIFVSKGVKQAAAGQPCSGFKPSANASVGVFCWQQVGLDRLAKDGGASPAGDPTLNVDPSRNGIEPDDAFTGPGDTVAWVVWYETGPSAIGLRANEQVFAAKIVADPAADGGFHWQAVGNGTATQTNVLDSSGANQFGACAASVPAEDACSLNKAPDQDAEDPRVAAGTLTPGSPTVPWVVWAEATGGGKHAIFISRLVGGTHFELSTAATRSPTRRTTRPRPDITFFGNVPYVSWVETVGTAKLGFVGHFEGAAFVVDTPGGIRLTREHATRRTDRLPRADLLELHGGPVHRRRRDLPGRDAERAVRHVHAGGRPAGAVRQAASGPCVVILGCQGAITISHGQAIVGARLGTARAVGILVQRIVRQRRVHGHVVRTLRPVGRGAVGDACQGRPAGAVEPARQRPPRSGPGRYVVTLRAFSAGPTARRRPRPAGGGADQALSRSGVAPAATGATRGRSTGAAPPRPRMPPRRSTPRR